MRAGTLNARVTIKQLAAGQDALGQPVQTWSDVATVWANVRHTSGIEQIKADSERSTVKVSIQIRYKTGLNAGMVAVHNADTYNIISVLPDVGGREYTNLVCELVQ
jgi:SPP1 family predicted phage head-tail adaptor